ncbi:lysophospholipid acyltransferase family protein [Desulfogranum japonicum]|uniref:lysophospholipid acyltransferase family protein n=1 Tax=Desulfogranum japonicum TaxID=231447 RepID=UPI000408DDE5|nr:lysophospholipid acyltransferase family protein [Desulfogranum japonicum]
MSVLQFIRALFLLIIAFPLTIVISTLALMDITIFRKDVEKAHFFPRAWGRIICSIVGVKVNIEGLENIRQEDTYIFAANHASQFDIFAFQGYFPHSFRWIAKKELFNIPVFGRAMRKVGYISIDRSKGRQALKSLEEAARQISSGKSVLIFPEGTRTPDGKMADFKAGAILLAIKAGVPVVPLAFINSYNILPKGKLLANSGTVTIRIGSPIATDHYQSKDKQALTRELQQKVQLLHDK